MSRSHFQRMFMAVAKPASRAVTNQVALRAIHATGEDVLKTQQRGLRARPPQTPASRCPPTRPTRSFVRRTCSNPSSTASRAAQAPAIPTRHLHVGRRRGW